MEQKSVLFTRDFSVWLAVRFLSHFGRKMVETALAWHIFQLTRSPLALGLIGLAEAIPFIVTSLWAGHLADRHSKKFFIAAAQASYFACAAIFWGLSRWDGAPLAAFYAVIALKGFSVSFDAISASSYAQTIVPKEVYARAAAWNLVGFTSSVIAAPILVGWLLKHTAAGTIYLSSLAFFVVSFTLAARLRYLEPHPWEEGEPTLDKIREGVAFVWNQPLIFACMTLDMIGVLLGDAVALFPIFAHMLGGGPLGFGILRASPAIGSALVSLLQATRPFIRPNWDNMKKSVIYFSLAMIAFALSPNIWLAAFFLMAGGMADAVSVIVRQSIYQAHTPNALRGRVAALSAIFISTSNELGAFESGVVAKFVGPVGSVLLGDGLTMLTVFIMGRKYDKVLKPAGAAE